MTNSDTFSSLQPTYFPGFAFSWMCLISHRLFMPKLLLSENREVADFLRFPKTTLTFLPLGLVCLLQASLVSVAIPRSFLENRRSQDCVPRPLSGYPAPPPCPTPRLPRIPQRVLLHPLRCHPTPMHPATEHNPECLPAKSCSPRPTSPSHRFGRRYGPNPPDFI